MESSSRNTLLNRTEYHFSVVRDYVSKFQPDLRTLSSAELLKQNLEKFFLVPKQFVDTLNKNELIAYFINFLLQLVYFETDSLNSLHEELRFLLMVLGDAPFRYNDEVYIINLLAEAEEIANIAGNLVHSFILKHMAIPILKGSMAAKSDSKMASSQILLERMVLLKDNILKFSNMLPVIIHESHNINTSKNSSSFFIVDSLICDVENLLNRDDSLIIGDVKDQINKLHQELMLSRFFFKSNIMDSSDIQQHVKQIIEVAYEVEYLINYFLAGDAPLWYFSMRLPHVYHKIELIRSGLQEKINNPDIEAPKVAMKNSSISQQLSLKANKRNFMVDDNIVVGLDDKVANILDKLVGGRPNDLQTIFIFGMPGLGKTTMAKKLYNHPLVSCWFDSCVWCVVSQVYHRKSLMIDILISLTIDQRDKYKILRMEERDLELRIFQSLLGRRYLIVIDDVWDRNAWDDLQHCFPDNGNRSKILITSRNKNVAPLNSIMHELSSLSNEQSWELLERKVFKGESCPSNLLVVGNEIAANCRGLPLAVVVVAGILSATDKEENAWKKVAEKVLSYSSCGENDSMIQILELSYTHLPQHLKPCFLYFGVFPEDEEISVGRLTRLWDAEGFLFNDQQNYKSSNILAEEYLMELINKSLIMVAKKRSDGGVKACSIHDRLRDLCLKVSEEENFLKRVGDNNESVYEKSHRIVNPRLLSYFPYVRSIHGDGEWDPQFFVANMKLVRVLDFHKRDPKFLADDPRIRWIGVEYLVNLRYLVIDGKWLSSSIGSLVNLEYLTVILDGPKTIPFLILKMDKLRYLNFTGAGASFDNDCNTSQINNLQYLSGVEIGNLKDEEMLKCSPHLRKLKCYCEPFYVEEKGRYLDLLFFTHLESLNMYGELEYGELEACKVERINFPSQIKRLNLRELRLSSESMSVIGGLPNLQVLKLISIDFEGYAWETRDGEFQQLTFLKLEYPSNLRQWNVASSQHFPKLQRLLLHGYVLEVPCEIGEIETLELIEVIWCDEVTEESVRNIEQQQRDMGNEELRVIIGFEIASRGRRRLQGKESVETSILPYPHDTKESEIDLISFELEEMSLEAEIPPVTQSDCDSVTGTREEEFSRRTAERHLKISMESTFPSGISISYPISPISISLSEPRPNNVKRSIQENVQNILGCITGEMTNVIAIYGDVGIGKSTVLKAIASHSEVKTTFDLIILVTVSRYWSTRKIQNEILQQLGHSPPADLETESEIAEKLFLSLKERRFLLLLDDLWDYIDLNLVGIPDLNMGVGCRVIIASTLPNICNLMATEVVMNMKGLYKEEALELFHKQLGEIIDSRDIQHCAKLIVERCCGLPLIIIVTGRALRNESDVELWRNARDYFLSIREEEFHGIEFVLQQLRFSYDRLKNQEVKNFLLYCVVFPEDREISVSELIEYCIKEGLIDGDLKDAHKKGHNIVEILVNAALLEKTEDGVFIKMHDVIRDFALWVLYSDADHCCQFLRRSEFGAVQSQNISLYERSERNKYLLRANAELTEAPTEKEWENAKLIFLMDNKLSNLPKSPICRDLLTLCLQRNKLLRVIPTSFFEHMSSLQVFNISETRIKSLPQSISMLKSLQTLILRNCENLVKLPTAIRFLVKLEILDLKGTEIYELPKEIGELTRLKHMEVSFFGYENVKLFPLVLVPHGIMSNLHALKKLCIFVSPGDKRWSKNVEKSIILEVSTLTMLTSLSFYFPKVEHLSLFLETSPSWKSTTGLSEFKFIIGDNVKRVVARVPEDVNFDYDLHRGKSLRFVNGNGKIPDAVISVLKRATAFYLDHHLNMASLSELGLPNMNGLKFCIIRECRKMSNIIVNDSATYHGDTLFTSLERLSIHYLLNLRNIYEGGVRMPIGSFSNLRVLSVQTCPKLNFLFSYSMILCFSNLEELVVEDCLAMEHILIQNNVATSSFDSILPRLKSLTLRYLPKLVNIWNGSSWPPVVEQMSFYNCPELKNIGIGNGTDNFKLKESLREIKAEKDWWEVLEWEDKEMFLHLKPHFTEITDDDLL